MNMHIMKQSLLLWIIAFLLTAGSAVYQRITGPTYPVSGVARLGTREIAFRLERSHGGESNAPVLLLVDDPAVSGVVRWKRIKTDEPWMDAPMEHREGSLTAALPHRPPGGKIEYAVILSVAGESVIIPAGPPVVIRFRGAVPLFVLIPHILAMFLAMLLSTRAGLETFRPAPSYGKLIGWTLGILFAGGLILGPIMQWYAFGEFWTGWPLGTDLTDNKTAVAFLGWVVAALVLRRASHPKRWILGAAILLLVVYMIPHSLLGTELDYSTVPGPAPAP
jgi:hypothetical protein